MLKINSRNSASKLNLFKIILLAFFMLLPIPQAFSAELLPPLKTGWFPFEPYMTIEEVDELKRITGLDIKMIEAVAGHLNLDPELTFVPWHDFLEDIKTGKRQLAPFATKTKDREQWAYFSIPYRWEENALYVRYGSTFEFNDVEDFIKKIKETNFILGVMDGFIYASDTINEFINDPRYAKKIMKVNFESDNLKNLLANKIDGFITDRLVGSTLVWRTDQRHNVEERPLHISAPIHFMISKKSETPEFVAKVNKAIETMRDNGESRLIIREYALPILIMQTIDRPWFTWIEVFAIVAFVLAGIIIAEQENFPIVAGLGLAVVPAFGGELARDIIVARFPVGLITTPRYVYIALIAFILLLSLINLYDALRRYTNYKWLQHLTIKKEKIMAIVFYCDAIGASGFTVIGVLVAVMGKAEPLWLWGPVLATITGVGGGTIRNILMGTRAFGSVYTYAEIPLLCGLGFSIFLSYQFEKIDPDLIFLAVVLTIASGCMFHLLVDYYKIPSLRIHFLKDMFKTKPKQKQVP